MDYLKIFRFQPGEESAKKAQRWAEFLIQQKFDVALIEAIDFLGEAPVILDKAGHRFSIDFVNDKRNYHKKKSSLKKELIGRALGGGRYGLRVLDLSAGLGIDSVFLNQLGFAVTAVERNPLVYLSLEEASFMSELDIHFVFDSAQNFLEKNAQPFDIIYFDPMFPEKIKSALPRQEMVFFRSLVGADGDADEVLQRAVRRPGVQRVVVKRPLKAPVLFKKPQSQIEGKLIRFDIYGVER